MPVGLYPGANSAVGNGVTTSFAYSFRILDQADLRVTVAGVLKVLTTDYTVTGVDASGGGNVVFNVAPANLAAIVIDRVRAYKRDTDYQRNGSFDEETVDRDFDGLEMQVQQVAAAVMRAFKAPPEVVTEQALTSAMWAARHSLMLGFDGAGNLGVFAALNPANPASAYILTLLDDADAATARNTLGAVAGRWPLTLGGLGFDASGIVKGGLISGSGAGTLTIEAVGADGRALVADSSQPGGHVYIDNPSRPNLITNPNWQIDQINEGALYTVNAADVRGPDGLSGTAVGAGVFKLRTVVDPDHPSLKAVEITCTTADAAIAAADDYFVYTAIEGYEAAALLYGEAGAKAGTYQFDFKSNVNGVYGVSVMNSAGNRRYVGSITVADAAEHTYSLSFTVDQAGAWLFSNGVGMYLRLCLAAGANFQTGAPLAWGAGAEQTVAAQANFMSNIANVAYLKRVQFIPGALVQAYKPADIEKELDRAQRQYQKTFSQGTAVAQASGTYVNSISSDFAYANAAGCIAVWSFKRTMRGVPTVVLYNPTQANTNWRRSDNTADTNGSSSNAGTDRTTLQADSSTAIGFSYNIHASANARLS